MLQAQATSAAGAPAAQQAADPKLQKFAGLHAELSAAWDEFWVKIAKIHTEDGKQEVRSEMNERITEIMTKHSTTQQEYERMIYLISSDAVQRAVFEGLLREIETS